MGWDNKAAAKPRFSKQTATALLLAGLATGAWALPPVANPDAMTVGTGGTVSVLSGGATSVLANDNDPEADPLTAVLLTAPSFGTLTLNPNGTFSYTHNGSINLNDSFTYRANDGTSFSNVVTVLINPPAPAPAAPRPVPVDNPWGLAALAAALAGLRLARRSSR